MLSFVAYESLHIVVIDKQYTGGMKMGTERNNKIKIKINGDEKALQEKKDIVVHDWKAKREVAAAEEKTANIRTSFDILKKKPKRKSVIRKSRTKIFANSKGEKYSLLILTISTISAIIIGVLIGIIILNLMVKDSDGDNTSSSISANGEVVTGNESVLLPSSDLYILQQGVYQNEDSVLQLEAEFKDKGLPFAYVKDGEKYRVFVAVTDGTESGKQLKESAFFKENFSEVYPTAVKVQEKSIANLTEDEKKLLELAYPLYEKLVKESSSAVIQGDGYSVPKDFVQAEMEKMKGLKDIQQKPIQDLQQSLLHAYDELIGFFQSKKNDQWLSVQNHLLSFVANYFMM